MNPVLRITIEAEGSVHSGIVLDMEAAEKAGADLFKVVVRQLIDSYKKSQSQDYEPKKYEDVIDFDSWLAMEHNESGDGISDTESDMA